MLKALLSVRSPSGEEAAMKDFILNHIRSRPELFSRWEVISGYPIQDCLMLKAGNPGFAIFVHMDTVGFTARYENQLLPVGSPDFESEAVITGKDSLGEIECQVKSDTNGRLFHNFGRPIDRGTSLVFKPFYNESPRYIEAPFLDNRVGIYISLRLMESIRDGMIVFSSWEESGGGSVPNLAKIIFEEFKISRALINDVTWVTDGVHPGKGTVVSLRDRYIPRQSFVRNIISILAGTSLSYQLEVEGEGSSDGGEIQRSPYPIDWCFIGPPVENTHSPHEKVHKKDIISALDVYCKLSENL